MSDPASSAASLGSEIVTDGKAFIQNVETDLVQDAEAAYTWLKAEYALLSPEIKADLKAAMALAVETALSGASGGSIVADTLTALYADGASVLNQVKSQVVTASVGLTTVKPATAS